MGNTHGHRPLSVINRLVEEGHVWYLTGTRHGRLQVNLCACPTGWCTRAWTGGDQLCDQCREHPECRIDQ